MYIHIYKSVYKLSIYLCVRACVCKYLYVCVFVRMCRTCIRNLFNPASDAVRTGTPPIASRHNISIHLAKAWESTPPAGSPSPPAFLMFASSSYSIFFPTITLSIIICIFSICLFAVSLLLLLLSIAIALRAWTSAPPEGDASAVEMAERRAECGEIRLAFCRLDLATPVFEDVDLATAVRGFGFDNICCFFEDLVLVTPVSRFWFW